MSAHPEPAPNPRAASSYEPTGVPNLDLVLGGGLPRGALTIIVGPPGSGKTTLANQIAFAAARRSQRVLVLTALSEPTGKLIEHLRGYQFYDQDLVGDLVQFLSLQQFLTGGLAGTGEEIIAAARGERAACVVLDGFRGVRGAENDPQMARQFLYDVGTTLSLQGTTTIITSEAEAHDPAFYPEMTTADVIVSLHYGLSGVRHCRGLEIMKMRAGKLLTGMHSIAIDGAGVTVYPRLETRAGALPDHLLSSALGVASPDPRPLPAAAAGYSQAPFQLPELDALLRGGLTRGTTTLLAGSPGVGKTLLGLQFALAGLEAGDPTLFVGFREMPEQLLRQADAFHMGAALRAALQPGGLLGLMHWEPVEVDPDCAADHLLAVVERAGIRRLVVDSITEFERAVATRSGAERLPDFMAALLAVLRARGITSLLIREISGTVAVGRGFPNEPAWMLAENVVLLQQIVHEGQLRHVLAALKTRFSGHAHALREFVVEPPNGIRVLSPDESGDDVLAWVARP